MSALILKAANEFSTLFLGTSRSDDSAGDRLSYRYTCAILVAFTIIVSNREFTSKRIQCWVPAFFTGNYEDYTNNVCWVRNTYYIDDNSEIPENKELRHESSIRYYQWIPFILLFQAFFFFLPYVFWRIFCQRSGIDIRDIVEAATNYKKANDEKQRERLMKFIVSVIDQYVDDPRRQSNNRETSWLKKIILIYSPSSGRYMGDYLRNLFIFTKFLYFANVVGQLWILSALLGQPFYSLGFTVIRLLYEGKGWDFSSRYFPKVTLCDFQIREANALPIAHTYTVMCVLPINLFNQQIFTFLWFWFVLVILLTFYDTCIWIYRLIVRRNTYLTDRLKVMDYALAKQYPFKDSCAQYVNRHDNELAMRILNPGATPSIEESPITGEEVFILSDGRKVHHQSRMYIIPPIYYEGKGRSIFDFYNDEYLEADGHFILRIIGTNASEFVATKIMHELYYMCFDKRFRGNKPPPEKPISRRTLYKYITIPKDPPLNGQLNQNGSNSDVPPTSNPFAQISTQNQSIIQEQPAPEIKRRQVHGKAEEDVERRSRSGTLPFIESTNVLQEMSTMRPGNGAMNRSQIRQQQHEIHHETDEEQKS